MDIYIQSTKSLSPLLIFFIATLLLLLNACDSQTVATRASNSTLQPTSTSAISTPLPTLTATSIDVASTPFMDPKTITTEKDSNKTVTYTVTSRFGYIFDRHKYPKKNMQITCTPVGTIGQISNIPSVTPQFYAVRYQGVQPGICTIRNGAFHQTVKIIPLSN